MKKIFASAAILAVTLVFAQKKEIVAAAKAIEANDIAKANAQLAAADAALNGQTTMLEPAVLEQYYYAKGVALLREGKSAEGAKWLAKISDMKEIYSGKDSSKNRVYFVGKEAADKSGLQGLKMERYTPSLTDKISPVVSPLLEKANTAANEAYKEKNYQLAATKFREVYDLLRAVGQDRKMYLYYSGLNWVYAQNRPEAIKVFDELLNSGYTGVETTYLAKEKKSGEVVPLPHAQWELYKKMGAAADYSDFKTEVSKSIEPELYETYAALLIEEDRNEDALKIIEAGLKKFPKNTRLAEFQGTAYYKSGKIDAFVDNLKNLTKQDPTNANAWYNLAVLQSKDPASVAEAEASFKKAVELKPDYADAWQNLAYLVMGDDSKAIDEYNAAKKANQTEKANKIIEARRARLAAALPYAEKWYQYDPQNLQAVGLLKGLYQSSRNEAKFKEFKAKEEAMKAAEKK